MLYDDILNHSLYMQMAVYNQYNVRLSFQPGNQLTCYGQAFPNQHY